MKNSGIPESTLESPDLPLTTASEVNAESSNDLGLPGQISQIGDFPIQKRPPGLVSRHPQKHVIP